MRGAAVHGSAPGRAAEAPPVLLLLAGTGGGHAAAAGALAAALRQAGFAPALCDPLAAPQAPRLMRVAAGWYEPVIRRAPWLWGALYHATDSRCGAAVLRRLARPVTRAVAAAVRQTRPAAIVSLHPLTGRAAVRARDRVAPGVPVLGVVTDLVQRHRVWDDPWLDLLVLPADAVAPRANTLRGRVIRVSGVPVGPAYVTGPLHSRERAALRGWLGVAPDELLVVVTGGAAGAGRIARQVRTLARLDGVVVVAVCGHNTRLARRLARRSSGRVRVLGFVTNLADWLRCADVVAGKAGPGTIAEATCCGAPLLLTSHVPGQERGNAAVVEAAGAGRRVRRRRALAREVARLRDDPSRLAAMRSASARLGRPAAAGEVAAQVADAVHAGREYRHAAR